ncbi:MAG: DUF3095 domain-containing protein [Chloroflexi bacterium]|nr:DUF3095 domain-containing protein [Chloroflexota bacterium]
MTTFYSAIPPIERINQITDPNFYYDVPADWHIALTDVKGSTQAIENGRYKDVNAVAAASITALLNIAGREDIPFMFGGDGATVLIPAALVEPARVALLATQALSQNQFALELRVGIVPVQDVLAQGYRIRVARLRMSDNFQQAVFTGGGLAQAETLLKHPEKGRAYRIEPQPGQTYVGDFSGFECRWNAIPSPYEETVSLLVQAVRGDHNAHNRIYHEVLHTIEEIYGDSLTRRPITIQNMSMALTPDGLTTEARVRYQDTSLGRRLKMLRGSLLAFVAMTFNIQGWGKYKQIVIEAIDNEKFDDTLRMIISGTAQQRERLRAYLETRRAAGELVYGTHGSSRALMTCVVFDYFGRQVHFIDAADGGYALAAREMKAQLAAVS